MISNGANFRLNKNFITNKELETLLIAVKQFADKVSTITDSVTVTVHVKNILLLLKIIYLKEFLFLLIREIHHSAVDELNYLICTPIDKATNNVGFVCSKLYIEIISQRT